MPDGVAVASNPAPAPAAAPAPAGGQAPSTGNGTPSNQSGPANGQGQSAPTEDRFSTVDPETLPPELKAIYKNLQSDYTKKTMSAAEKAKKAEAYDHIVARPDFKDFWSGMNRQQKADFKEQKVEAEKRLGEKITDERFAKAFNSKDDFLALLEEVVHDRSEKSQKKIAELEGKLSVKDAADVVESFATQIDKGTGQPVRPDFYHLDEDNLITGFLTVNPPEGATEQAYLTKLNDAYTWAKQVTQKYYEKGRSEALARIQQKAATSSEPPTQAAKGAYTGPDPKKLTVREAMDLAKKNIRVPRDD